MHCVLIRELVFRKGTDVIAAKASDRAVVGWVGIVDSSRIADRLRHRAT